jgi:glycosyltransferase involved in cell wall biosynthesis
LIFLNVANLRRVKNQERLFIAFSRFLREDKSYVDTKLIICGTGLLENELRALAYKLGIESKVMFFGKVPRSMMPEVYSVADAFILPSLHEAHPWSLLEAMSCGLPVAASDVGGIPETLPDREQLLNPWKTSDIYRAMVYLARDAKRRKNIGSRNRKIILKKFTFKRHVKNLSLIYDKVLCNAHLHARDNST